MFQSPIFISADGISLQQLGYGVMENDTQEKMDASVSAAIDLGIRHFDNAFKYGNEALFGVALKRKCAQSGLRREDVFVSSKIRTTAHPYDKVRPAIEAQLKSLDMDYMDCCLIHWPLPGNGEYLACWKAFEKLIDEGLLRCAGLCNVFTKQLRPVLDICNIKPAYIQIQCHPYFMEYDTIRYCQENGIQVQAWGPLRHGSVLTDPVLIELGKKYGKNAAQVTLRWLMQKQLMIVVGTSKPHRLVENYDILDFTLNLEDMQRIDALECNSPVTGRGDRYDPEVMDRIW